MVGHRRGRRRRGADRVTDIIIGQDATVASWLFEVSGCRPMQYNMAVGLADHQGELVGGILFTGWNGSDVEVHIYAPGQLTRKIVRLIFGLALMHFNVNRVTVRTRKKSMARGCVKLGAVHEAKIRRLYGPSDRNEHAGNQYAFFRETIERLAGASKNVRRHPEAA